MMAQTADYTAGAELRSDLRKFRMRAGIAGALGAVLLATGALISPVQFFRSYLWAYIFVLSLGLGPLAWLMLQYLTGGAWGVVIRRPAEAAARTLPLLALLFIPVLIGIPHLYEWSHAEVIAGSEILQKKQVYLNAPFFIGRTAVYFAGWMFLAWFFNRWSAREDREGGMAAHTRMARAAGPGLVFWGFSVTFMAIDWVMSINPEWLSTMFGLLFMASQGLTGIAFLIIVTVMLSGRRPLSEILTHRHLHDLGKFMLALVMVWAYFAFSQFLIIWAGNLPEEVPWYLERLRGGWEAVGMLLVIGHFALPFALLLSRDIKRNFRLLRMVAIFILCMRLVDLFWLVAPSYRKGQFGISWIDLVAPVGLFGIWLAYFFVQLEKRPLLPVNEPHLEGALQHGRE